jgi:hypothetical protein
MTKCAKRKHLSGGWRKYLGVSLPGPIIINTYCPKDCSRLGVV